MQVIDFKHADHIHYKHQFERWINKGAALSSSGTTDEPKTYFQSPRKIKAANKVAVDAQEITKNSRIYTVCSLKHAGGLLAQTLPAYSIGASIMIGEFNAYQWVKKIGFYTHSHITPGHAKAIMGTKGFSELDLTGIWITCGSDPIDSDIIEAFLSKGAIFMCNWGMTEIGPIAINKVFRSLSGYQELEQKGKFILGDQAYCDVKIVNSELYVKGEISIFGNEWYATGDLVKEDSVIWYEGRKSVS